MANFKIEVIKKIRHPEFGVGSVSIARGEFGETYLKLPAAMGLKDAKDLVERIMVEGAIEYARDRHEFNRIYKHLIPNGGEVK